MILNSRFLLNIYQQAENNDVKKMIDVMYINVDTHALLSDSTQYFCQKFK